MSEPKHTPGPWLSQHRHVWARGEGIEDHCIVERTYGRTEQEVVANARLIAAAPALLAALEKAEEILHAEASNAWNALTVIRAALAAAHV